MLIVQPHAFSHCSHRCWSPASHATQESPRFSRDDLPPSSASLAATAAAVRSAVNGQNWFPLDPLRRRPRARSRDRLLRELGGRRLNFQNARREACCCSRRPATSCTVAANAWRFGSAEYEIVRQWIAGGAKADPIDKSRLSKLRGHAELEQTAKPGESYRLKVEAAFADGTTEDVTRLCAYESVGLATSPALIATALVEDARASAMRRCRCSSRADAAVALVLVPRARQGSVSSRLQSRTTLSTTPILAKLKRFNIPPSELCRRSRHSCACVARRRRRPADARRDSRRSSPTNRRDDSGRRRIEQSLLNVGPAMLGVCGRSKFCDILNANDYGVYA